MTTATAEGSSTHRTSYATLMLTTLGIVYGDIGTSPLYALRECFNGVRGLEVTEGTIMGLLSLVFWSLILVISGKYMMFVLRADNRGEGGILALTALASPHRVVNSPFLLFGLGIVGASLLYGDGIIMPAVTVLSAIEGLSIATLVSEKFVIVLTIGILMILFGSQKYGSAKIGAFFGPVMLLWFSTIAVLGIGGIFHNPRVLFAVSPHYAIDFFVHHKLEAYFAMGALFLVVTGAESVYADMGHFGKRPIRRVWFSLVLPALLLNYFGQGALLLEDPKASVNPFFHLAPSWGLIPLVVLATAASVIASQALISGVFSLTRQAIQLGLCPRLNIVHTSAREIGQIYLPQVNWALFLGTVFLVISFRSSSNLAAAYGISVSLTMVVTTVLIYVVMRRLWGWTRFVAIVTVGFLLLVDLVFVSANLVKIEHGGYVPLLIGAVMYTLMSTWRRGRQILADRLRASVIPLADFLRQMRASKLAQVPGVAIFMVGDPNTTPPALVHNVKHNKVMHELIIILTVITKEIPTVKPEDRLQFEKIEDRVYQTIVNYGFTDSPDMMEVVGRMKALGLDVDVSQITFFLGRETLIASDRPGMAIWREHLFAFMVRNAQRATAFFNIPVDQVVEVGIQVEL